MSQYGKRPPAMGVFVDSIIHGLGARLSEDGISFGKGMTTMFLAAYHDRSLLDRMAAIMDTDQAPVIEAAAHAYMLIEPVMKAAENPARIALQEFQESLDANQQMHISGDPGKTC
jgi:hypothetical protein